MRTLQGRYKAAIKQNEELIIALEKAEKHASSLSNQYQDSMKKVYEVTYDTESSGRILNIKVLLDILESAKSRENMFDYLCQDIARKAGWIK